jgi:branched-chain amino acid transport system permease protein
VLQVLLSGLAIGAIYGLVALGFGIAFYVTRVINFAQGQLLMIGVMVTAAVAAAGVPAVVAVAAGVICASGTGTLCYLLAVRPVLAFDRFSFAWLVSTLGAAVVLENGAALIWGPTSQAFPALFNGTSLGIGPAALTWQQVAAIVMAIAAGAGFELVRRRTLFGKLGMAIAFDPEMASALGANPTIVAVVAFAIAGLLAGVAGVLIGPRTFANPYLGETYGIYGFVAMMIGGGTEQPVAAMLGGLVLGILGEAANALINSQASDWFPFLILVAVLLLMPRGLFGSGNPVWRLAAAARGLRETVK